MRFPFPMDAKKESNAMLTLRPMTAVYLLHGDKMLLLHREGSRVAEGK